MLSSKLIKNFWFSPHPVLMQIIAQKNTSAIFNDKDPAPFFFDNEVQNILKILIRPVAEKVFRKRLDSSKIQEPQYKFMTNEQLFEAQQIAEKRMWKILQIPPFVKIRQENIKILSKDPALTGYCNFKHVFTDITYGVSNKNRVIVVREPDGILRTATHEERDRLNQIYFPIPGREIEIPKMFEEENLQNILDREDYEFILNRACIQFDPDHSEFHRVTQKTYEEVNSKMKFEKLRSTRHYGSLVFYLAWKENIKNLLYENIQLGKIEDAALLIKLYYMLKENKLEEDDHIKIIQYYLNNDGSNFLQLQQSFKMYCQIMQEKKILQKNIECLHEGKSNKDETNT